MKNFWEKQKKPILALAPMAGYTDSAWRQICKKFGADVLYSEMVSVDAIVFKNAKTLKMLGFGKKEMPIVFQLFGSDPKKFGEAVKMIPKNAAGVDINFGCPAQKVTKNGSGSALMNEVDKSYAIIKAVCENTPLPVSIKIRTKVKDVDAIKFIKKVKDLPWTTVMIHGRTFNQGFGGEIDFEIIKKVKELVPNKIVLANGGVHSWEDAKNILDKTGADGIGIARGAWGRPWIFKEIKKQKTINLNFKTRKKIILRHAKLFLKYNYTLEPMRKHLVHYTKGLKNASALRQKLIKVNDLKGLKKILG